MAIGVVATDGMVLQLTIRASMPADTIAVIVERMLLLPAVRAVEYPVLRVTVTAVTIMLTLVALDQVV